MSSRLRSGIVFLSVQQAVSMLSGLVIQIMSGRALGPELYGIFALMNAISSILVLSGLMGIPNAVSRGMAQGGGDIRTLLKRGLLVQGFLSIAVFVLLILFAPALSRLMGGPALEPYIRIVSVLIPVTALSLVFTEGLNGLHRFGRQAVGLSSMSVLKVCGVGILLSAGTGLAGALWGQILGGMAGLAVVVFLFRPLPTGGTASRDGEADLLSFGTRLSLTYLALGMLGYLDLIFLKILGSRPSDTGLFSAADTVASGLGSVFLPLIMSLFPVLSKNLADLDRTAAAQYMTAALRYAVLALIPACVWAAWESSGIIWWLYGDGFAGAAGALSLLVIGALFYTMFEIFFVSVRAGGRGKTLVSIGVGCLVINILLDIMLIPRFELYGAVSASVATYFAAMVMAGLYVASQLRLIADPRPVLRSLLSAGMSWVLLWFLERQGLPAAPGSVLFGISYIVLLVLFGELRRRDLEFAGRMVQTLGLSSAKVKEESLVHPAPFKNEADHGR